MRSDMAKVVTETPRRGHGNKSKKVGGKLSKDEIELDDHGPVKLPVSRWRQYGWNSKEFSDLLGPLRKYLRKQVNRPWDKVYSELSETLDKRSLTGLHIWDHVRQEVTINCFFDEKGDVVSLPKYFSAQPYKVTGLYVHPKTGLLLFKKKTRIFFDSGAGKLRFELDKFALRYERPLNPDDWRIINDLTVVQRVNGAWFMHSYKLLDPDQVVATKVINDRIYEVRRKDDKKCPTKTRICLRQLSKQEIKLWGLK
jgi:hypothetical protein